jgi:hypothetical protein
MNCSGFRELVDLICALAGVEESEVRNDSAR